jgi:hypothetical protein
MIVLPLLIGAAATPGLPDGANRITSADLLAIFKATCMHGEETLGAPDPAALPNGFEPVSVEPFGGEPDAAREIAAWERAGVRISKISPQTDPRWPLSSMCAVKASVSRVSSDFKLMKVVGKAVGAAFASGHMRGEQSNWTLVTRSGLVQIFIDRTDLARAVVTISSDAGSQEKAQ